MKLAFPWALVSLVMWFLQIITLQYISAGQFTVLLQSRLLAKPLLAYVVIGEKRSGLQVVALGILLCGVLQIVVPEDSQEVPVLGVAMSLGYVLISTMAMVYTQYASAKCSTKEGFCVVAGVQMVLMNAVLCTVEAVVSPVTPRIRAGQYLALYWLACAAMDIAATLVVTKVSAVGLSVGAAVTVPVTMIVEVALSGASVDRNDTFASVTVAAAVVGYAMAAQEYQALTSLQNEARALLAQTNLASVPPTVLGAAG